MDKRIRFFILVCIIFSLVAIIAFSLLPILGGKYLVGSDYDSRANRSMSTIKRGDIYDRNNVLLNYSIFGNNTFVRKHNFPELYCHLIGYVDHEFGTTGLENLYNSTLQGTGNISSWSKLQNIINKNKVGESIVLAVDHNLQQKCRELIGKYMGAIVITDPKNGEILAYYSNPTFDESNIKDAINSENSNMLDRVRNGKYSPGSVFKLLSAVNILNNAADLEYDDNGTVYIGDGNISNYGKIRYGKVDLHKAFEDSLNTYFSEIGLNYVDELIQLTNQVDEKIKSAINNNFAINIRKGDNDFKNAILQIGQGELTASPLAINLITQAIYNGGYFYEPKYVSKIYTNDFKSTRELKSNKIDLPIKKESANYIKDAMYSVVKTGTAKGYGISENCGGKTGTAELPGGKYNYWFSGFVSGEKPMIITIVVENVNEMGYNIAVSIFNTLVKQNL